MKKLKHSDMKLLSYLYHHNRQSLTKIAKETGLSREQVDYKLKQYIKKGIIKSFTPIINYAKIGYQVMIIVLIKFNSSNKIQDFKKKYEKDSHRITTVEIDAKYDLGLVFVFKDQKEKNEYLMDILEKNREEIEDTLIIEPYHMRLYPLKFLKDKKENDFVVVDYDKTEYILDKKEKEILNLLNKDARMRVIDIAYKTGLSAELVVYKLKRLQKEGVFLGSRGAFDMQKLGYYYTILQMNIKNLSQKLTERLESFAKNSFYIDTFYLSLSKPNCYMQLFHKTEEELRETIRSFKEKFKEESFEINIVPLKNEGEDINTVPFF